MYALFRSPLFLLLLASATVLPAQSLSFEQRIAAARSPAGHSAPISSAATSPSSRRSLLAGVAGCAIGVSFDPNQAVAKLVLNEDTGEYDEVKEEDWQTAWKARLDKAQSMSSEEIFMAAQGAGNTQLREGEESEASKKRRAMAGCRNDAIRKKAGGTKDVIACNSRVMSGDFGFVLEAMQ